MKLHTKELTVLKKVQKDYPEFADSSDGLPLEELRKNLGIYSKYAQETIMAREKDEELQIARDNVKELAGPYNDTLKALKLKLAYINIRMDEKKGEEA